jgi:hypothetical protein
MIYKKISNSNPNSNIIPNSYKKQKNPTRKNKKSYKKKQKILQEKNKKR